MGKTQTPSLEEMLSTEAMNGVSYATEIEGFIDGATAPVKDGKQDVATFISDLVEKTQAIAGKYFSDPKNPRWVPNIVQLQGFFETYRNPFDKNGKLRQEVKTALKGVYTNTSDTYVAERADGRLLSKPIEAGKQFGVGGAKATSNKFLVPIIEGAHTVERVAQHASRVVRDYLTKAKEWYQVNGSLNGFKEAYAFGK